MTYPRLSPGQFAVGQAEVDTGIFLAADGEHRHIGTGKVYRVFDSLGAARALARGVISARPRVECAIYDSEQRHVEKITVPA